MKQRSEINFKKAMMFEEILSYRPLCQEEQDEYDKLMGYCLIKPKH